MAWFGKLVLGPGNCLRKHCVCIQLLQDIHDIVFALGDAAVNFTKLLESILIVHGSIFLELYGLDCAKQKFHYCYHLAKLIWMFGRLQGTVTLGLSSASYIVRARITSTIII